MVTKNFKALLGVVLQQASGNYLNAVVPATNVKGKRTYISTYNGTSGWTYDLVKDPFYSGISIGRGTTPATEDDYNLEDTITSGVNLTMTAMTRGADAPISPWVQYEITVTNTGSESLTVGEIGFKQSLTNSNVPGNVAVGTSYPFLFDRAVLNPPITIAPGDAGIVHYKLKTINKPTKTIGGVEITSWEFGTDEQIAAMIEAARLGTIDLQTDAGWQVGDVRPVQISAFTGGGSSQTAQTGYLVISDFAEYENCGNVMQFDFLNSLTYTSRMNSSSTNVGGYGESEMKTTTLPALVEALPSWLQGLLKTFDVKASAGNKSSTIETVTGNKLALRSEVEVFGTTTYSAAGEGTQVELYKISEYYRKTRAGNGDSWWERSPNVENSTSFCSVNSSGAAKTTNAGNSSGLAPFGCI